MDLPADLDRAARLLREARRPVAFSGAGLSAESGIATFRGPGEALWAKFDPARLASQQGFAEAPEVVIDWYAERRRKIAAAMPNAAHRALANRPGLVHITQNVDDLLERAGAAAVTHLHGTIGRDRCNRRACGFEEPVDMAHPPPLRRCPRCGERVRPAVVWFGELLPEDAWMTAETACLSCDVMLVIGTSAVVYPAAGLIEVARGAGARIIVVNTEPSEASRAAEVELIGPAGRIIPKLLRSTA